MAKQVKEVLDRLYNLRFESRYLERLEELTDELRQCAEARFAVEPVLRFIEAHPDQDLGAPGPLVHFLEEFYNGGYEQLLLESVARKATALNLWMLNRVINGSEGTEKDSYVNAMRAVAVDERANPELRDLAREFLS